MAITDVLSMIFHFQVTKVSSCHMRSFFLLITHVQEIFGHAFEQWVQHNYDIFPHIIANILELSQTFNYSGCVFPSSQRHIQEHLSTMISYSHEACFHPDMNQSRNFFDERQHWTYSTIINAAYNALITECVEWNDFIGPVVDILRQWNHVAAVHHNHKTAFKDAMMRITRDEWYILPNRIKWYIINKFPDVAMYFDTQFLPYLLQ